MGYHYTENKREELSYSLPDVDVFHVTASEFVNADSDTWMAERLDEMDATQGEEVGGLAGWYYAYGMPGYLHDSECYGPYDTEEAALSAAREHAGCCEHGIHEEEVCEECPAPELWVLQRAHATPNDQYAEARYGRDGTPDMPGAMGWTDNPRKAMAWATRENAIASRDRMEFCAGCIPVRLPDDEARNWGS